MIYVGGYKGNKNMVKYFSHERRNNWTHAAIPFETEMRINSYAEKNNLEIVSISCIADDGIFVVFKEKL